jgi:hypothetical protein
LQWRTSIETLIRDLEQVSLAQRIECRYEDFVARPEPELKRLFAFIGVPMVPGLARDITPQSIGKWRQAFSPGELAELGAVIGDLMVKLKQAPDLSWYHHSPAEA